MKLTDFRVLTFDCYGTLIDWETGIFAAMQPMLSLSQSTFAKEEVLEAFALAEWKQEVATPGRRYPDVLAAVLETLAKQWALDPTEEMGARFGASVPDWPAFADSAAALAYLKQHYKLVILSNVDRSSFRASSARLGVEFDAVYTAEDIGSYKPDPRNFEYLLNHIKSDLGFEKGDILHTAQSLFHDHKPAKRAGLATAWIDRRHDQEGWGATVDPGQQPKFDLRFVSLADLVEAHKRAAEPSN